MPTMIKLKCTCGSKYNYNNIYNKSGYVSICCPLCFFELAINRYIRFNHIRLQYRSNRTPRCRMLNLVQITDRNFDIIFDIFKDRYGLVASKEAITKMLIADII
jgi:hypothetical protein